VVNGHKDKLDKKHTSFLNKSSSSFVNSVDTLASAVSNLLTLYHNNNQPMPAIKDCTPKHKSLQRQRLPNGNVMPWLCLDTCQHYRCSIKVSETSVVSNCLKHSLKRN